MSLDVAQLTHQVAGRYRLRIPARRRDVHYFQAIVDNMADIPQILSLTVNHGTASVLIEHDGLELAELTELARQKELFDVVEHALPLTGILDTAVGNLRTVNAQLVRGTGEYLDLRAAAFVLLVTFGVRQLIRGNLLGPAATLFWYAFQMLMAADKEK